MTTLPPPAAGASLMAELADLCRADDIAYPSVSRRGNKVAFFSDGYGSMSLNVLDLRSGERELYTTLAVRSPRSPACWAPDDSALVIARDHDGNERHELVLLDFGREPRIIVAGGSSLRLPVQFSPDGRWISVLSDQADGRVGSRQLNLWKVERQTGRTVRLTGFDRPVSTGGRWSPDGLWLVCAASAADSQATNEDVYVVGAEGGARRVLSVANGSKELPADWHPDSRSIAITSNAFGADRVGILDALTGETRWISDGTRDVRALRFSADGRTLLALENANACVRPVLFDVASGARREPPLAPGLTMRAFFALNDSALLLHHTTDTSAPRLTVHDLASGQHRLVSSSEPSGERLVRAQDVLVTNGDGTTIPALLYLRSQSPSAAVVQLHGGPQGQFFHAFDPLAQILVRRGFAVLQLNVRGSTGYGTEHRDACVGDWGGRDLTDVVAGARYIARQLLGVDPACTYLVGSSYGAYLALLGVLRHPAAFGGAIAWAPLTDLLTAHADGGEMLRAFLREQMGDPLTNVQLWRERSPITYASTLRRPVLLLHGVNDARCDIEQSRAFATAVAESAHDAGAHVETFELPQEGHGSAAAADRVRALGRIATNLITWREVSASAPDPGSADLPRSASGFE